MNKMKKWVYGIKGIEFIWNGQYNDPTLVYKGKIYNYFDFEDSMWSYYSEECEEKGIAKDNDKFPAWVKDNQELAYELINEMIGCTSLDKLPKKLYSIAAVKNYLKHYKEENFEIYEYGILQELNNYTCVIIDPNMKYKNTVINAYHFQQDGFQTAYSFRRYNILPKKYMDLVNG